MSMKSKIAEMAREVASEGSRLDVEYDGGSLDLGEDDKPTVEGGLLVWNWGVLRIREIKCATTRDGE